MLSALQEVSCLIYIMVVCCTAVAPLLQMRKSRKEAVRIVVLGAKRLEEFYAPDIQVQRVCSNDK